MSEGRDTGDRILDAAADLFTTYGYAATTTRALAARAGVNEVTVFRRFGSKQGVLRALAERIDAGTAGAVAERIDADADLRTLLVELAAAEVRSAVHSGGLALRLAFDAAAEPAVAAVLGPGTTGNAARLASRLAVRQTRGELRPDLPAALLAETFFALTSSLVLGRLLLGGAPPDDGEIDILAAQLVALYLDGAAPSSQERE